jgi:hypothetical protein
MGYGVCKARGVSVTLAAQPIGYALPPGLRTDEAHRSVLDGTATEDRTRDSQKGKPAHRVPAERVATAFVGCMTFAGR